MTDVWKYDGREFAFDIYDVEDLSRLSAAFSRLKEGVGSPGRDGAAAGACISRFFDEVLGDGTAGLLFAGDEKAGDGRRLRACAGFADFIADRCRDAEKEIGKWEEKYLSPLPEASGR